MVFLVFICLYANAEMVLKFLLEAAYISRSPLGLNTSRLTACCGGY
jgi:hypothetical protein